jgi:hypothetical protein
MKNRLEKTGVTVNSSCRIVWIKKLSQAVLLLTLVILTVSDLIQAQQKDTDNSPDKNSIPIGETLLYSIDWDPPWYLFFLPNFHAGDVKLHLVGKTEFKGKVALKIAFEAHSSGLLSKLYGMDIDDEFIFLSEPETFCTLNVSKKIHEGKQKRKIDVEYFQDTRKLHIVEYDIAVNPPELIKDKIRENMPSCIHDPFSALYALRRQPLSSNSVIKLIVGQNDIIKEVESRVKKLEDLDSTAGKIKAWKLQSDILVGGLFKKGGQFSIWLSADSRQVPLQFEAKGPLGRVFGRLIETRIPVNDKSLPEIQ